MPQSPLVLRKDTSNLTSFDDEENSQQLHDPIKPKRSGSGLDESWASFVTTDTSKSSIAKDPPSAVFIRFEEPYAKSPLTLNNRDPPSFQQ
jgi:hypothetical protein